MGNNKLMEAAGESLRINVYLPPAVAKALNDYEVKVATKIGKLPWGINGAIGTAAIKEWLIKNEDNVDPEFIKKLMEPEK